MAYFIAAIIILILIVVILGVLVVPFQISMELYREGSVNQGYLRIRWLKLKIISRKIPPKTKKEKKKTEKREFDYKRIPKIISLIEESLPYIINIFMALLKSISVEKISLNSIIGLGDSADTAVISGYLSSLAALINIIPNTNFSVEPDLQKERLDGSLILKLKLKLIWITLEFLKALTKKPFRSLLGELRKMRR